MVPLAERTNLCHDRFYDVQALTRTAPSSSATAARSSRRPTAAAAGRGGRAARGAPYAVRFADDQHGFISGQDGLILHTADGGKSWQQQESNAFFQDKDGSKQPLYLSRCTRSTPITLGGGGPLDPHLDQRRR